MRFGGGCRKAGTACNAVSGVAGPNCVNTPATDPADSSKGLGYSVYYALDITDPQNPSLLWEFSDEGLGFSTTGPAIVRIDGQSGSPAAPDATRNGHWYVVIGSGPTGPIDVPSHQFMGRSDQNLKLYILDLRGPGSGSWTENTNYWVKDTGLANAFSGSLMGSSLDADNDYQDEIVYVPYTNLDTAASTWTQGGVLRLVTNKSSDPTAWTTSTLIDGVGPVTAAVTKILDTTASNLWVYFGTGRYYFVQSNASDDANGQQTLYAFKDPCMTSSGYKLSCTTSRTAGELTDVTDVNNAPSQTYGDGPSFPGCFVNLAPAGPYTYSPDPATSYMAERDITDPLATSGGVAFFTTFQPYTDLCELGGKSFIWALQYDTCGLPSNLKGVAIVQVSTGAIQQENLSQIFSTSRKSGAIEGKPPEAQGLSVQTSPPPVNRYIHMQER